MLEVIFIISAVAGLIICILAIFSTISEWFEFWPPPSKGSWQYHVFWNLFRIMLIGLVAVSIIDFNALGNVGLLISLIGVSLITLGFGCALFVTAGLGWRNAHGEEYGLKVDGWYRWSRNPIYVVTLVGLVGWGLLVNSSYAYILISIWALMYVFAPFLEEPWLERHYGEKYLSYKSKVPRFLGRVKH